MTPEISSAFSSAAQQLVCEITPCPVRVAEVVETSDLPSFFVTHYEFCCDIRPKLLHPLNEPTKPFGGIGVHTYAKRDFRCVR
jgi:hypothetical protein